MKTSARPVQGKRVLITGATSGVGREMAQQLAELGAEVIIGCRDPQKGKQAAVEITAQAGLPEVVAMRIDTSSQASIRSFAQDFRRRYRMLDSASSSSSGS